MYNLNKFSVFRIKLDAHANFSGSYMLIHIFDPFHWQDMWRARTHVRHLCHLLSQFLRCFSVISNCNGMAEPGLLLLSFISPLPPWPCTTIASIIVKLFLKRIKIQAFQYFISRNTYYKINSHTSIISFLEIHLLMSIKTWSNKCLYAFINIKCSFSQCISITLQLTERISNKIIPNRDKESSIKPIKPERPPTFPS